MNKRKGIDLDEQISNKRGNISIGASNDGDDNTEKDALLLIIKAFHLLYGIDIIKNIQDARRIFSIFIDKKPFAFRGGGGDDDGIEKVGEIKFILQASGGGEEDDDDDEKFKRLDEERIALGMQHFFGWDISNENIEKALNYFQDYLSIKKSDTNNDKELNTVIGFVTYMIALCHDKNKQSIECITFCKRAIKWGNCLAMNKMSSRYQFGRWGVKINTRKALDLLSKSTEFGYSFAMFNLGVNCVKGDIIERDLSRGVALIKKAIKMGEVDAIYTLAHIYENAEYGMKNIKKCVKFYLLASEFGNVNALVDLGLIYQKGGEGVIKDVPKAIAFYERAVEKGNTNAMFNLGHIYRIGDQEVTPNLELAIKYFEMAVNLENHQLSLNYLGYIYENSEHRDLARAIKYYERGIELGNARAMYNISLILLFENEFKNVELGLSYLNRSVELGNINAINRLANIYQMGGLTLPRDLDKVIQLLEKGHSLNDSTSSTRLGKIYHGKKEFEKAAIILSSSLRRTRTGVGGEEEERQKKEQKHQKNRLISILALGRVEWREDYHCYFRFGECDVDSKIICILLCSKHRNKEENRYSFLIKGIVKNIIKYLCHSLHLKRL